MRMNTENALLKSLMARANLIVRLMRCTDDEIRRCASTLDNLNPSDSVPAEVLLDHKCNESRESVVEDIAIAGVVPQESSELIAEATSFNPPTEVVREIAGRISKSLQDAREKTEDAVLAVCDHVAKLVEIATQGNEEAEDTLRTIVGAGPGSKVHFNETSIAEVVHTQAESVNCFVADTREFFNQQIEIGNAASRSFQEMELCVAQVVKLVFSSEILAYNIQIESARLGDEGRAFSVLGDEMVRFSSKVRDANIAIQSSLKLVTETMRHFQEQSKAMDARLDSFTEHLQQKMDDVRRRTTRLTDSLHLTLDRITNRNREVISCSHDALSELQFQDPLAQNLLRTEREVERLRKLVEGEACEAIELECASRLGNDGMQAPEPGMVDLFGE